MSNNNSKLHGLKEVAKSIEPNPLTYDKIIPYIKAVYNKIEEHVETIYPKNEYDCVILDYDDNEESDIVQAFLTIMESVIDKNVVDYNILAHPFTEHLLLTIITKKESQDGK